MDLAQKELEKAINLYQANDFDQAKEIFLDLLKLDPQNFILNKYLSFTNLKIHNWHESLQYVSANLKNDPLRVEAYLDLALILLKNPNHNRALLSSAVDVLKDGLKIDPNCVELKLTLYNAYELLGNLTTAKIWLDRAAEAEPRNLTVLLEQGNFAKICGDFEAAEIFYKEILSQNPRHVDSIYNYFFLKKFTEVNEHLLQVESYQRDTDLSLYEQKNLSFALFKAYDDLKDYKKAYSYLKKANEVVKATLNRDSLKDMQIMTAFKGIFTKAYIDKKKEEFKPQVGNYPSPIFIVSMPRSGSTLVEKILSSHSKVSSAGEPLYFKQVFSDLRYQPNDDEPLKITNEELQIKVNQYLKLLSTHAEPGASFVIDKLPLNFAFLGLIKILFPDAKIIYLNRDPCAVGFSCYKHMFSQGQNYSFATEDIVNYYRGHKKILTHWSKNLTGNDFLKLDYEGLVADSNTYIRELLAYCDLTWEDSCERFYETKAQIQSASLAQVRKPIYQGSNDAWKNYQPYMEEFFEELKNL